MLFWSGFVKDYLLLFERMKYLFFVSLLLFIGTPFNSFAQSANPANDLEQELATLEDLSSQLELLNESNNLSGDFADSSVQTIEVKATVTKIVSDVEKDGVHQMVFLAEDQNGEILTVDSDLSFTDGVHHRIHVGSKVYLQTIRVNDEVNAVFLVDVYRIPSLFWMVIVFSLLIILVGLWRGVASLLGLLITLIILFAFLLPAILRGADAVLFTVLASIIILAVNMHLSHGFNKQTLFAYSATVVGLVIAFAFSKIFMVWANLTGLAAEESTLLYLSSETVLVPSGILLSGIILGAVGVLDDIAITQTETVAELKEANPDLTHKELFMRAMRVGRHHIASTVNTLVLAYAGAALPLLLLFMLTHSIDVIRFINEEVVAEEIVRTLAGTTALILTVPIATWFATFAQKK